MQANLQLLISFLTLGAFIFGLYKYFRDPDVKNFESINLIKQACKLKHSNLDSEISAIKNNHLSHIEKDIADIKISLTRIETILEEREKQNRGG